MVLRMVGGLREEKREGERNVGIVCRELYTRGKW
jgi:hypothetical protein